MDQLPSDDRPVNSNGAGQQERVVVAVRDGLDDSQTLTDGEQTLGEVDQTLAAADQTAADSDQLSSDRDQIAADSDQAASDRDLAEGVEQGVHSFSRDIRQRSAREREQTARERLEIAGSRDAGAYARDVFALVRDQAAAARDLAMSQRDRARAQEFGDRAVAGAEILVRGADQRVRAAKDRARAAEHRASAASDREAAREDREQAARDRLQALADREALAEQLAIAETDALTGARTRAAGLVALDHELERCSRASGQLVVCYVDVVGLKALNDSEGHSAGDELRQRVVTVIRARMRPYDLVVRLGGDEFLCAMSNMSLSDARKRFSEVDDALARSPDAGAIRVGFAQLTADEVATDLIARADKELLAQRK